MESNLGTGGQLSRGQQEQSFGRALPAVELEPRQGVLCMVSSTYMNLPGESWNYIHTIANAANYS